MLHKEGWVLISKRHVRMLGCRHFLHLNFLSAAFGIKGRLSSLQTKRMLPDFEFYMESTIELIHIFCHFKFYLPVHYAQKRESLIDISLSNM